VTGVDKAPAVVAEVRSAGIDVYELDVRRLRELQGTFDAVICMWASFGWFDDATNADVFEQMADKTRPGGVLVLDVYDPAWFRAHQGPHVIKRNGRVAQGHRNVVGTRLHTTLDYEDGSQDVFEWRLYEPDELSMLGAELGLVCEVLCGEFGPEAMPVGDTPRMQLVFRLA
jgi:SAM-dependent methyltransferase